MTAPKVGDVVAWADVPDGALVRHVDFEGDMIHDLRLNGRGWCINSSDAPEDWERYRCDGWPWHTAKDAERVTIVALGLTGKETAADLQRLAEVFEVRAALDHHRLPARVVVHGQTVMIDRWMYDHADASGDFLGTVAACLHAAGWRPGMTAEDAARLLAGSGS